MKIKEKGQSTLLTLDELARKYGTDKLNSLTKYPSILTYHKLGPRNSLVNELVEDTFPPNELLEITEKVDGTNGRLVFLNGDYYIGSRDDFVHVKGDTAGIIEPMERMLAKFINSVDNEKDIFTVIYGEVYGHNILDGSKIYCPKGNTKKYFRVFDVWQAPIERIEEYLANVSSINQISYDREHNSQAWFSTDKLQEFCDKYGIERTPIWGTINSNELPVDLLETKKWLEDNFKVSHAIIGEGKGTNQKFARAEGVVIRTLDRKTIRKLRFENYNRSLLNLGK